MQLKKIYSELNKLASVSQMENGPIAEWYMGGGAPDAPNDELWDDNSIEYAQEFVNTYLLPHLHYTQVCNYIKNRTKCTQVERKDLRGNSNLYSYGATNSSRYFFVAIKLTDGMLLWLYSLRGRVFIVADINGDKKPNVWGKDIFEFYPDKEKNRMVLYGEGLKRDVLMEHNDEGCNTTSATNVAGRYCGALILNDNWQIKKDYPW